MEHGLFRGAGIVNHHRHARPQTGHSDQDAWVISGEQRRVSSRARRSRSEIVGNRGSIRIEISVGDQVSVADYQKAVNAEMLFVNLVERAGESRGIDALGFGRGGSPLGAGEIDGLRL